MGQESSLNMEILNKMRIDSRISLKEEKKILKFLRGVAPLKQGMKLWHEYIPSKAVGGTDSRPY